MMSIQRWCVRATVGMAASMLAVGAPIRAANAQPSPANGLTYEFESRTLPSTGGPEIVTTRGHVSMTGTNVRIDFDTASHVTGASKGFTSLLMLDNGRRFVWMNSNRKQYYESGTFSMQNDFAQSEASIATSNIAVDVQPLGPGPTILNRTTTQYRMSLRFDMTISMLGQVMTTHSESVSDMCLTTELGPARDPFLSITQGMAGQADILGEEFAKKLNEAAAKLPRDAFPLRTVSTIKSIDPMGKSMEAKTVTEVTRLTPGSVNETLFGIPSGYEKIDLSQAALP